MHFTTSVLAALVAAQASFAIPVEHPAASHTVYLAGDSTMAPGGGGAGTQGWGEFLRYSLTSAVTVVNDARAGRSARSYTREGRFTPIINAVRSGDFVIIEFGHNDGGSLTPTDNGRSDCLGDGSQTCQTTYDGVAETVLTYPAYLENAANSLIARGAHVIMASPTPDNLDETGTYTFSPNRFVAYARAAASSVGADFVDHQQYVANAYRSRSVATVNAFYPNDHTHTSPEAAAIVAHAFVKGLMCGNSALKAHVRNTTSSIEGSCV